MKNQCAVSTELMFKVHAYRPELLGTCLCITRLIRTHLVYPSACPGNLDPIEMMNQVMLAVAFLPLGVVHDRRALVLEKLLCNTIMMNEERKSTA